ncbi:hypothetical protein JTB14_028983 [Gonioctena quinquepunctata]|nr:hypothetical protein JTB14_028983 [Gonioctena quinquepunctata]
MGRRHLAGDGRRYDPVGAAVPGCLSLADWKGLAGPGKALGPRWCVVASKTPPDTAQVIRMACDGDRGGPGLAAH